MTSGGGIVGKREARLFIPPVSSFRKRFSFMAYSNVTAVLIGGIGNVNYQLATADYPDAVIQVQNALKNGGGIWGPAVNASASSLNTYFYPASSILYLTVA
jgi:hypothetical protein